MQAPPIATGRVPLAESQDELSLESPEYAHLASEKSGIRVGSYLLADSVLKAVVAVRLEGVSAVAAHKLHFCVAASRLLDDSSMICCCVVVCAPLAARAL